MKQIQRAAVDATSPFVSLWSTSKSTVALDSLRGRIVPLPLPSSGDVPAPNRHHADALFFELLGLADGMRAACRLGFLLDEMSQEEISEASRYASRRVGHRDRLYLYLWCFSQAGVARIESLEQAFADSALAPHELLIHLSLDGSTRIEPSMARLEKLCSTSKNHVGIATFHLSGEVARAFPSIREYTDRIFEIHSQLFQLGFAPFFVFHCLAQDSDPLLDSLFRALCFSGIYPRNLYVSFSSTPKEARYCELYEWDWDHYVAALPALRSRRRRVFEPLAAGFAGKLRALMRDGQESAVARACPFAVNSMLFGAGGRVSACPIVAQRNSASDLVFGCYRADELDSEREATLRNRAASTVSKCRACKVAPLCGSGCPLEAEESEGGALDARCPPVDRLVNAELEGGPS